MHSWRIAHSAHLYKFVLEGHDSIWAAVKWREVGSAAACLRTVLQTKRKSVSMADKGDGAPPRQSFVGIAAPLLERAPVGFRGGGAAAGCVNVYPRYRSVQ